MKSNSDTDLRLSKPTITTTAGESFTWEEHKALARLVYKRFGRNLDAACLAWRRLLENSCPISDFADLVGEYSEEIFKE